ncbi:MAG: peptidylprolyl isomerase [Leptolyngbyaceae cyanobacterium bins.59]|nr:peptidylprolyl isomerase [Leptolyngbyaceae cyanobacterium bins.59]
MPRFFEINEQLIRSDDVLSLLDRYQMLPQLAQEIIVDRAIADIEMEPDDRTWAYTRFYQFYQLDTPEQQEAWRKHRGITPEQLEIWITREWKVNRFKEKMWGTQIQRDFLQRKDQLDRVVYSLLRTQKPGLAKELYFRIQAGETSFAEAAQEYSEGPEAQSGGMVGPVEMSQPHPVLARILMKSQVGQLFVPISLPPWTILLRLEQRFSAHLDEAMHQRLLDDRFQQWIQSQRITCTILQTDYDPKPTFH